MDQEPSATATGTPGVLADLGGRVALVTGAGRGIGRAIARGYARAGASVVLVARTRAQLEDVAAEIRAEGGVALVAPADVTDRVAVAAAIDATTARFGRLDLVVANAGALAPDVRGDALDDFDHVLAVNCASVHALARLAEPHLRVRGGKFVVIGSGAGRRPFPGNAAYSTSKAAVAMLVRCLAVEWRAARIAVNEIVPGIVRTEMAADAGIQVGAVAGTGAGSLPEGVRLDWHKSPDDVVPLALFLAGLPDDGPSGQVFSLLGRDG